MLAISLAQTPETLCWISEPVTGDRIWPMIPQQISSPHFTLSPPYPAQKLLPPHSLALRCACCSDHGWISHCGVSGGAQAYLPALLTLTVMQMCLFIWFSHVLLLIF